MMVLLEMLARAYGNEREAETFDPLVKVDEGFVDNLAEQAFDLEKGPSGEGPVKEVVIAKVSEIPEGNGKLCRWMEFQSVCSTTKEAGTRCATAACIAAGQ